MSVKKSERNESKLSVILKAESITVYTIEITGNEKYFPKRHRWSLTVRLVDATLDMLQYVVTANSIRVKDAATSFVNRVNEINGVTGATLVTYNGDYMS